MEFGPDGCVDKGVRCMQTTEASGGKGQRQRQRQQRNRKQKKRTGSK